MDAMVVDMKPLRERALKAFQGFDFEAFETLVANRLEEPLHLAATLRSVGRRVGQVHAQLRGHLSQMPGAKGRAIVGIEPFGDPEPSDGHGKAVDECGGPFAPSERGEYDNASGIVEDGQEVGLLVLPSGRSITEVSGEGKVHALTT